MIKLKILIRIALALLTLASVCLSGKNDHHYNNQEEVPFYVNKIGPYSNPSETYDYYSLPFCQPEESGKKIQHRHASLSESLEGDTYQNSLYRLRFAVPVVWRELCPMHLTKEEITQFKSAIEEYYFFEFLFDDIPIRGFIGTMDKSSSGPTRYFLFKHLHFLVFYNKDRIIHANVTADLRQVQELNEDDIVLEFSYSVKWIETDVPFEKRMEAFNENFFQKDLEIHWLSILNSFVLVILLTGFIAIIILRVLKSDYSRYQRVLDDEDDQEDYGWKLLHGDVFRFPQYKMLFCSVLGNGAQFLCISIFILCLALIGIFYPGRGGSLSTAAIVLYALTAGVAGFVSSSFYKKMEGEKWAWNIVLTATLFTVPLFVIALFINAVASSWDTTTEISFGTITTIVMVWLLVGFPLTVVGGITGKRLAGPFDAPCRTKNFPREIPSVPWYRNSPVQMVMAGFLPFSAIYIELYYIYTSVWGHNSYTLYGILFVVFVILLIVTACITIALTYFQLSMEDHRWWWRSLLSGGSTGVFIYIYSFFYYYYRSKMTGFLQGTFFFGYMLVISYFFFLLLGTVGFYSSLIFVRHIYRTLKCD